MTPTSIGLIELVGLAYILVCSGIPPKLTSQASKLHLASSTLVSLSQIVDLRKNILPLLLFSIQRYEKIESKYGAKCENLLSVFTIASNPGHLAPFSQKKRAQSAQSLRLIYFQQKLILRQNIFSKLPKVQRTQHQHHHQNQHKTKLKHQHQLLQHQYQNKNIKNSNNSSINNNTSMNIK